MSSQIIIAFLLFSVSMSLTPGAGNITLLGIANRYGFSAALPFIAGTAFGVLIVFGGTSAGLLSILTTYPQLYTALKYIGAAYLLYVAWGITTFKIQEEHDCEYTSGFISGLFIQILNPKAWIAAMTVFSQFTDVTGNYLVQIITIIVSFLLVVILCTLAWAYFGAILKHVIQSPGKMLLLNRCLGSTLAITVVFMLIRPT